MQWHKTVIKAINRSFCQISLPLVYAALVYGLINLVSHLFN